MIGVDYFFKFLGAPCIRDNVHVLHSKVGVVLGGTIAGNSVTSCNMVATVLRLDTCADISFDTKLQTLWELDSVPGVNSDSSEILDHLHYTITFENV